jgi:hypothetical protein
LYLADLDGFPSHQLHSVDLLNDDIAGNVGDIPGLPRHLRLDLLDDRAASFMSRVAPNV